MENSKMEKSPKGSLPYGWSVHVSTKYPNKLYYFNAITGDTTWDCPKLDPPRILSTDNDKEDANMSSKNKQNSAINKSFEVCSPETRDDKFENPANLPTAVVSPVFHKSKEGNSAVQTSGKKVTFKRKSDVLSEKSHDIETTSKPPPVKKKKKDKYVSPLNKYPEEEISSALQDKSENPPVEKMSDDEMYNCIEPSGASLNESSVNDIEMRDVSVDLLDDLTEKKETVFDASACYYIVVDTNVLIRDLDLINELKDTPLDGCGPPHIFIPWVVIEELDKLKSQKTAKICGNASEAIRYLNSVLGKHPRFHGQSPAEAEQWAKKYSKNNDDKILECCMGLSNKMLAEKVILLTNDKNLVNKARICKINVYDFESMIKKVKPDTTFNCKDLKSGREKNREKEAEVNESTESQITVEQRMLHSKRDKCKREIHNIMSSARLLLKDVLYYFLSEEMTSAYGDVWNGYFPIETKLLKGLLEGILKYWRAVFSIFLTEKDKRNIELLLKKTRRPEGFFGDKDECLVILSAVEDLFHQIKKRQPELNVPIESIQDHRVACVNAFISYCEAESEFRLAEDQTVREVLDDNWTAINELCGIIMDHYEIPHTFDYYAKENKCSDVEIQRLMVIIYPTIQKMKRLFCEIYNAVKNDETIKKAHVKGLTKTLLEFIPSLNLPYVNKSYSLFNTPALEKWLVSPQNRQKIEVGVTQIETFFFKTRRSFSGHCTLTSKRKLYTCVIDYQFLCKLL